MKNSRLIVVLGMHRSGTSAVTRGLQVMGIDLGGRLMPPVEGNNAKGFWEDLDLYELNIEMLNAIDSDWHCLSLIGAGDVEALRKKGFFLRAVAMLREKVSAVSVFGFKDPRVAKLLPFWMEVFAHCQFDVHYVLAMRHPLSVVKSLVARDGMDAEKGYLMWLEHVIVSIAGTASDKRVLTDYDRLMEAPERELNRIAEEFSLTIDRKALQEYKAEFLDQSLRHTVYTTDDLLLDEACPSIVGEIYTNLLDVASDKVPFDDAALQKKIERWRDEVDRLKSPLKLIDRLSARNAAAAYAVAERDGHIVNLTQAVAERDGQIHSLNLAVAERDGQIHGLNQAVAERDGQIHGLNQAVAERDGQIHSLSQAVAERDHHIANLNQALAEREAQFAGLNQTVAECNGTIQAIISSRSWRVTRPLRKALDGSSPSRIVMRRTVKLAWWTLTLQLGKKLRQRRLARIGSSQKQPHFAPPTDDVSFKVPFEYSIEKRNVTPSVAVICHLYYPDLLEEVKGYLANIPFSFDVFITTDTEQKKNDIANSLLDWDKGAVEIRVTPNRGRDIAPKLIGCRDVYDRYEFFLHIHSKKSPHADALSGWRHYLLETLLGSEEIVSSIFDAFESDSRLGMVGVEHFHPVRGYIGWGWNFEAAKNFGKRLGIACSLDGKIDFPSGSMFWGRSAAIRPLLKRGWLKHRISINDFAEEASQVDGTLGHLVERLYYFVCEKAGYRWIKIVRPDLLENVERMIRVEDKESLKDTIMQAQYGLLAPDASKSGGRLMRRTKFGGYARTMPESLRMVHARSEVRETTAGQLCGEPGKPGSEEKHVTEQEDGRDFDEQFYLAANPDVAEGVKSGSISSGYDHYRVSGQYEGRVHSDGQLKRRFSINPNYPSGFLAPVANRAHQALPAQASLDQLPESPRPFLLILFSHLQEDLFFAGYSEFFKDHAQTFERFSRVIIAVQCDTFDRKLALRYSPRIEVMHVSKVGGLGYKPDVVIGFNAHLTCAAHEMLPNNPERVVYFCQDFEAGFFSFGADYVIGEKAIAGSHNLIVSTELLRKFLDDRGLVNAHQVYVTRPKIEILDVSETKTKRLFFYYRPESFNRRNLPEAVADAVREFCYKYTGYEIYMVGSVATAYSFKINGTQVYVINKLPKKDYIELISSCDVVVSMIYAAHPGVIAYQAAASGIPTVTNVFENRDASLLKRISRNIVPYDPVRDDLLRAIEEALAMPKGRRDFDEALYSGDQEGSLVAFYDNILSRRGATGEGADEINKDNRGAVDSLAP